MVRWRRTSSFSFCAAVQQKGGEMVDVRGTMEPLGLLDLSRLNTVGQIVDGMSRCSFGARMLGEVAETLVGWATKEPDRSYIVFDGWPETRLSRLLIRMVDRRWFRCVVAPDALLGNEVPNDANLLVVGGFSERQAEQIFAHPGRTIFINNVGLAKPGQIRDGYFPDAVFADPNFVLPVLKRVIEERQRGGGISAVRLIDDLSHYNGLAGEVAHAAETLDRMIRDPEYTVFLTMSGAMTVAKMGLVVCDLIDRGMVQAISSTGSRIR